jgi:hypothetical protein
MKAFQALQFPTFNVDGNHIYLCDITWISNNSIKLSDFDLNGAQYEFILHLREQISVFCVHAQGRKRLSGDIFAEIFDVLPLSDCKINGIFVYSSAHIFVNFMSQVAMLGGKNRVWLNADYPPPFISK